VSELSCILKMRVERPESNPNVAVAAAAAAAQSIQTNPTHSTHQGGTAHLSTKGCIVPLLLLSGNVVLADLGGRLVGWLVSWLVGIE